VVRVGTKCSVLEHLNISRAMQRLVLMKTVAVLMKQYNLRRGFLCLIYKNISTVFNSISWIIISSSVKF